MSSNTCEIRVGRLLEIRVASGYRSPDDVTRMMALIAAQMSSLPIAQKCIVAADWRGVKTMSPAAADRARTMLLGVSARVLRSGILTLSDPITNLQVQRLVREAENMCRRHFTSVSAQFGWLSEVLEPAESARLAEFLGVDAGLPP